MLSLVFILLQTLVCMAYTMAQELSAENTCCSPLRKPTYLWDIHYNIAVKWESYVQVTFKRH